MKRLLLALTLLALALPAAPKAEAAVDVSVDFFYNNLGSDGSWVELGDYGYCWQPAVAASNTSWRPYADGYWAYTDVGWTWVSNESFGWATYHYGRWARVRGAGWVWVPGQEWAPAWVSWRTGGDYIGWAPLPPDDRSGGGEVVYQGRPIGGSVDIDFDIGPDYYNFVNIRYIGEPSLRERIYAPTQNITYVNQTVNVTNITYNNSVVYNYGPDINRVSAYSTRPIRRMKLQRRADMDYNTAAQAGALTKVEGDTIVVGAPQTLRKSAQPVAPKNVKRKIAKEDLETGWTGVSDPKAKADLQQKMKGEDPKTVPPPQVKPTRVVPDAGSSADGATPTPAEPDAAGSPGKPSTPASPSPGRGKGKNKRDDATQPSATPDTTGSVAPVATPAPDRKGKGKNKRGQADLGEPQQSDASSPNSGATAAPTAAPDRGKGQRNPRPAASPANASPSPVSVATPAVEPPLSRRGGKKADRPMNTAAPERADGETAGSAPQGEQQAQGRNRPPRRGKKADQADQPDASPAAAAPQAVPSRQGAAPQGDGQQGREKNAARPQVTPGAPAESRAPASNRAPDAKRPPAANVAPEGNPSPAAAPKGNRKKKGEPEPSPTPAQ